MSKRMLIDARHSEETRVTVVKGNRVEEFDYESANRRQLKGNIYLARVTRVEPSLQAAFVEYGGNRHGFLAFNEIHPDYYQLPAEDREALLAELSERDDDDFDDEDMDDIAEATDDLDGAVDDAAEDAQDDAEDDADTNTEGSDASDDETSSEPDDQSDVPEGGAEAETSADVVAETVGTDTEEVSLDVDAADSEPVGEDAHDGDGETDEDPSDDAIDAADENDEEAEKARDENIEERRKVAREARLRRRYLGALRRRYSIQEVIKKRQVLLIQVVKEERGNKGAALTTYMSLAGRYCVLMPNSTHSGGISRKISSAADRKRLKNVINGLKVPSEMGLIIRTAGTQRTKAEIKRDYEYLVRLWNGIRELTLKSVAPALIYEEADLIKRTIRDLYTRDIDEIYVEGEEGYRSAKDFMKLLMPSHAKKVQHYSDHIPLFHRYQVETALENIYRPVVQLKSGGYVVINPTEALISIDVNSGRSTKEHNIEETAVKTNIEAAEEVARQLRLRDMAGLVVIDFIDMEERSNVRAVEKKMKDMLKSDRARIQVGRISGFGLMELSRQRLRPNLLETSMETCPHCQGTGYVKSVEFAAISILRQIEEEGIRARSALVRVIAHPDVAVYLLNKKRKLLMELEERYHFSVEVVARTDLSQSDALFEREAGTPEQAAKVAATIRVDQIEDLSEEEPEDDEHDTDADEKPGKRRRRRRRRRRGGADGEGSDARQTEGEAQSENDEDGNTRENDEKSDGRGRRRRGRRGGRRQRGEALEAGTGSETTDSENVETGRENKPEADSQPAVNADDDQPIEVRGDAERGDVVLDVDATADDAEEKPKKPRRRRRTKAEIEADKAAKAAAAETDAKDGAENDEEAPKPRRRVRRKKVEAEAVDTAATSSDTAPSADPEANTEEKPKRRRRSTKKADADTDAKTDAATEAEEKPKRRRRTTKKAETEGSTETPAAEPADSEEKPKRRRRTTKKADAETAPEATSAPAPSENTAASEQPGPTAAAADADKAPKERERTPQLPEADTSAKPKKKGWWQRPFG